jgi:transcriptional regulator with XRE-family HTH domain
MTFADRLKQLRTKTGLTERELADKSGVAFEVIHEYGLGRRAPTFSAVVAIARVLKTDCKAFMRCSDIVKPKKRKRSKKKG